MSYLSVVTTVLQGLFLLLVAYYAWSLNKRNEASDKKIQIRKEKIELYTGVYVIFETAMNQILNNKNFTLQEEFSKTNAKMQLLADDNISDAYFETCIALETWSTNHAKSQPPKRKIGDMTLTTIQSPNPREKYEKLAEDTYLVFREKLDNLVLEIKKSLK